MAWQSELEQVRRVVVETFDAATHLQTRRPKTTEDAQYSLPYPVACALAKGRFTVEEIDGNSLDDEIVLNLADLVEMRVDPRLEDLFPEHAMASVTVFLKDGSSYRFGPVVSPGDAQAPPSDAELESKFADLTTPVLGKSRSDRVMQSIRHCAELKSIHQLTELLSRS